MSTTRLSTPATVRAGVAQGFEICTLAAPLGAELLRLDLSRPLAPADFDRRHRAYLDHHVPVFRDQCITPAQQVEFFRHWGALEVHVLSQFLLADQPEILVISHILDEQGRPIGLGDSGHYWHSDLSHKENPSLGSMLHAIELPEQGGDTLFANQHLTWEMCLKVLKHVIEGLRPEHSDLCKYDDLRAQSLAAGTEPGSDRRGQARHSAGGAHPSRERLARALRQRAFHYPQHRPARGREPRPAAGAVRAEQPRRADLPPSMAAARQGVLEQPLGQRSGRRLCGPPASPPQPQRHRWQSPVLNSPGLSLSYATP